MPVLTETPAFDATIETLLAQMTLAEKVGQMTQVEKNSIAPADVRAYAIGSVLSGGGGNPTPNTPAMWAAMARGFEEAALESRLGIPLLYGVDAVHGHNNVVGATIFPHNVALGAARDLSLVERVAQATACELLATNVHWTFAPEVSVPQDIRWGRTYEGYGEEPGLVSEIGAACVRGLQQSGRVMATAKHFVADGGTDYDSTRPYQWIPLLWQSDVPGRWNMDQGDARMDEATLRAIHLPPYAAAIVAGARCIMPSYSSWNGVKLHAHRYLLTDVLKGEMGFDGFLISDWMAVSQLDPDAETAIATAINAGLDMVMVPFAWREFIAGLIGCVESGAVSIERLNDAVARILRVKLELNLFDQPFGNETLLATVGCHAHRALAREAVRKSMVLLKHEGGTLPLTPDMGALLVAGALADDLGAQCGGWTIEWQGGSGRTTQGTTILDAIRLCQADGSEVIYDAGAAFEPGLGADVGIAVIGERPYAEGEGDSDTLALAPEDVEVVHRLRARCKRLVVILISGRPLIVEPIVNECDTLIAAWLPGTEGKGVADVLFGRAPFTGKLPYTWPRAVERAVEHAARATANEVPRYPYGFGLAM